MIVPAIITVFMLALVVTVISITRVKSHETLIITSSGNIDKTLESGLNFVNPLSETHRIDGRKRRINIPEVGTIGSDDKSILMDNFYVIMSVSDAIKVFNMDSDVESRVSYEVQNILKQATRNVSIEETSATEIASIVENRVKKEEDELGIEVHSIKPGKIRQG
jgi:hypothetical protein